MFDTIWLSPEASIQFALEVSQVKGTQCLAPKSPFDFIRSNFDSLYTVLWTRDMLYKVPNGSPDICSKLQWNIYAWIQDSCSLPKLLLEHFAFDT
jgi:hypothetical protein